MNGIARFLGIPLAAIAVSATAASGVNSAASEELALTRTVPRLDAGLFDAFNHCDTPGELQKHAGYLAKGLEFYHVKKRGQVHYSAKGN